MDVNLHRVDIEHPRYDQNTYMGRAKHFFLITNPRNFFATTSQLEKARNIVVDYRAGKTLPGLTEDELWRAKQLYDSAYHPVTGEKMSRVFRMSASVPMNMTITGCMLAFYKTTPQIFFWQWANQTYNSGVNYVNNSGSVSTEESSKDTKRLLISYVLATSGAILTATLLKRSAHKFPPLIQRYIPFAAVASANCVNIPCMRSDELMKGIPVFTKDGQFVGESKRTAKVAITQVVFSRIAIASPCMLIPPIIMQRLEKGSLLKRYGFLNAPMQILLVGAVLCFSVPLCCAIFPQRSSAAVSRLEQDLQEKAKALDTKDGHVYYNKGL